MKNAEGGKQKAERRTQKAECRRQKAECRRQNAEGKMQNAKYKRQNAEGEMQKAECKMQNAEGGKQKAERRKWNALCKNLFPNSEHRTTAGEAVDDKTNCYMKKTLLLSVYLVVLSIIGYTQKDQASEKIPILLRLDDIGMCHSVNVAAEQVLKTGLPVSMSVMVPCPWFTEAVEILKKYKNVSVGIHLVLNSEWKNFRWGPVAGVSSVPTLVDSLGNFFPSRSLLYGNNPKLNEIETELRAQIDKALKAGLKIEYLDYHMGAAVQTPETRAIVEKLAAEYKVGISRYFDEVNVEGQYTAPIASKLDTLTQRVQSLKPGGTKLFVFHIGLDSPEMSAMEDLNPFGPKEMSKHRYAELSALLSPSFQQLLQNQKYRLVNYRMMNEEKGRESMRRPL